MISKRNAEETLAAPFTHYIKFLGKLGDFESALDVYNSMEDDSGVAPTSHVFSALFYALHNRKSSLKSDGLTIQQQNASDAKLLWRDLERSFEKHKFHVDHLVLSPVLLILMRGRDSDRAFAFNLIKDYVLQDDETSSSASSLGTSNASQPKLVTKQKIPINRIILRFTLESLNDAGRPEETLKCIEAFKRSTEDRRKPKAQSKLNFIVDGDMRGIDVWSLQQGMIAYAMLADKRRNDINSAVVEGSVAQSSGLSSATTGPTPLYARQALALIRWAILQGALADDQLWPRRSTWNTIFGICLSERDWDTAREVFLLLSGVHLSTITQPVPANVQNEAADEVESATAANKFIPSKSAIHRLDIVGASILASTAAATGDIAVYQQFLRMLNQPAMKLLLNWNPTLAIETDYREMAPSLTQSMRRTAPTGEDYHRLCHSNFIADVRKMIDTFAKHHDKVNSHELALWSHWRDRCASKMQDIKHSQM